MNNKDYIKRRDEISSGVFTGVYRGEEWAVTGNQGLIDQAIDQLVWDVLDSLLDDLAVSEEHPRDVIIEARDKIVSPQ